MPDRNLHSEQSTENPVTWFVKATVTAQIKASDQGAAMQEMCDRLASSDPRGAPSDYGVNTVDAERVSLPIEDTRAVDELLKIAGPEETRS